ncbi:MAG: 3D-(3,5/4)-trihydroxycyclohexane-1,2-dione acylhydrolase (decyclizing), partial [Clostridiales bacterium]|nr:3D-(3,5/4)-trihydroxycyclohexane-1,2-dione acylhydrolase (decyclizing) [Clostridiales bacterium]
MNKTIRLTVGEAVVRYLDNQYVTVEKDGEMIESKFVENFYAVFGHGCVLGVGEALSQAKHSIKVMQGKNEQGMAHAAISYAKMNNRLKIIPCMSSIGPGAANMVTAAATATVNNLPLLLFMGDSFASRQPDPVLQQIEQPYDPTITTNDAFRAVTKFFDRVTRPEMIMSSLTNAMRVLTSPAECGAAAIAICQDVQGESFDFPEDFFRKRVHFIPRAIPNDYEVKLAAEEIKNSKKPLVIVGGGVRYSFAGGDVKDFCEKYNIPFAETQGGKSSIESSHPLNLGGIGATGNLAANTVARDADLIIGIGTRFSDFTTSSKWLFASSKTVTINVSPFHAEKF